MGAADGMKVDVDVKTSKDGAKQILEVRKKGGLCVVL